MLGRALTPLQLTWSSRFFSRKLKGPASQRYIKATQVIKENANQQKQKLKNTVNLKNMYFNNYTPEEMEGTNEMVRRVFKLENATPNEVLKYRIERAVKKFQKSPTDCGGAAVQSTVSQYLGAVMSEKIVVLMAHVKRFPTDKKAGRSLTYLVQKRRAMLNYLQRTDYHYFRWVCADYGIPNEFPLNAHHKSNFRCQKNALQGI